jgi:hypothetical protein
MKEASRLKGNMRRLIGLLIIASSVGCAHSMSIHYPEVPKFSPKVSIDLHGDTAFSEKERQTISLVALTWNDYSNGLASINLVFDLDFDDMKSFDLAINQNTLVRSLSSSVLIQNVDMIDGADVLGFVSHSRTNRLLPQRMYLVQDRLENDQRFFSVVLHEFGHMLWMNHVDTFGTLMYHSMYNSISCPTKLDMEEFCKANECKLSNMKWCIP